MLRHAQHERILVNNFKTDSVRPELGRRTPNGFSTACQAMTLTSLPETGSTQNGKNKRGIGGFLLDAKLGH
jgi:hypothetical protein